MQTIASQTIQIKVRPMSSKNKLIPNLKFLTLLITTLLLSACASHSKNARLITQNNQFSLVSVRDGDSYASLAEEFMEHKKYASVVERYNPDIDLSHTDFIAIPRAVVNPSGVFAEGFQRIPILCYHQFTKKKRSLNRTVVTEKEFKTQMAYLYDNGYQVVTLDDAADFILGKKELPQKSVVITVDDGYKSFKDIALPILQDYQFPSTMFVYPEFIGAGVALSWQDIKQLVESPLVDIQSHSTTHSSLSRKPKGETERDYQKRLEFEVLVAQQRIFKRAEHQVSHFAYPYGNTSKNLVDMLQAQNYKLAVTVQRGSNPSFSSPFLVNRTMIYGGDSLSRFKRSLNTFEVIE